MNTNDIRGAKRTYGVNEWLDQYGNRGTEVLGIRQIRTYTARVNNLFQFSHEESCPGLMNYLSPEGNSKRRVFVVVDSQLSENMKIEIEDYFARCTTENLIQAYTTLTLALDPSDKTLGAVSTVITAAKKFGLKRRDLFIGIGGTLVTDVTGFAAAVYRRSTPWILVPTDLVGIFHCVVGHQNLRVNHTSSKGTVYKGMLAVSHPPIASLYDPRWLDSLHANDITCGLAELVRLSVDSNRELFSCVEAYLENAIARTSEIPSLIAAVECAARPASPELSKIPLPVRFSDVATRAVEQIKGITYEDPASVATGIALSAALSAENGYMTIVDLSRVLDVLKAARLTIYEEALGAEALWEHLMSEVNEGEAASSFIVPTAPGEGRLLTTTRLSSENITKAVSILCKYCPKASANSLGLRTLTSQSDAAHVSDAVHELVLLEEVEYHVATVPGIFTPNNPTIIQNYCSRTTGGRTRKVLVIADDYVDNAMDDIEGYFKGHASAIRDYRLLPMHVSSKVKEMESVLQVINAAVELSMSQHDIFVVVGGGTLMDIVGFAAAIYRGGTSYLRIPTTLVGMIDAGVGIKTGVNFGNHKSLVGRYFAPVACLNDPQTFLATLSRRDFACGLAESIKMAILKSPRLFEVIDRYHRNSGYNTHTDELIHISIITMLEELQPNLHEHNLLRPVDFGHEFGHIIESLARHEIPHGECVAIGMAISSSLAYRKGILARSDLDRVLKCILDLGLPIYATDYDCCNEEVLWTKISTEGIEHKDGMLYLAIPETIGRGGFLYDISDINTRILSDVMISLKRYSSQYAVTQSSKRTDWSCLSTVKPSLVNGRSFLANGQRPHSNRQPPLSNGQPSLLNGKPVIPNGQSSVSSGAQSLYNGKSALKPTAGIIGASGDIGSQLASYLVRNDVSVICCVRHASLNSFERRMHPKHAKMRILTGDLLDVANLRTMIESADVIYNMAGIVTLGSKPTDFAKVLAVNGFVQGVLTYIIQHMGRDREVKIVYPSSQRIHMIRTNQVVEAWVQNAAQAYSEHENALITKQDVHEELERFAQQHVANFPLPTGFNIYDISKRLGEHLVSRLPRHVSIRISGVYGPTFTRGFVYRAINPKPGSSEVREVRDFIYIDDLNELLYKAATTQPPEGNAFDGGSGESLDLERVWDMARELMGHDNIVKFENNLAPNLPELDTTFARQLLGRDTTPMEIGLRKTIDAFVQCSGQPKPLLSRKGKDTVGGMAENRDSHLRLWNKPYIIVVDVGATYLRVGIVGPDGLLLHKPTRISSPGKHSYPEDTLPMLQQRLLDTLVHEINLARAGQIGLSIEEVGISFGAVVTQKGVVEDASILWDNPAQGYDFKKALFERMPHLRFTILNDISAAAWRYKDEGRFCLITVSSGLSNKVFNADLRASEKLELDPDGIGGEMGHVVVEPRAVDAAVQEAISQAIVLPESFRSSQLYAYVGGDPRNITAHHLRMAVKERDSFAMRCLEDADIPSCACGNIADLCSYSSGRAALRHAKRLASREKHGIAPDEITDGWLQQAITAGKPLALQVLHDSTYPLALRIMQLAADIGLQKFIIVGGFAVKTGGRAYLQALQDHLARLWHQSAFFRNWSEGEVRGLVKFGADDDDDGLIGMGNFVHHLRDQYRAVEKAVGDQSLSIVTRSIPRCGAREFLLKVVYAGLCTTDLQILRGERGLEPKILGHEGVCQVVEVGRDVKGLSVGEVIVLNPNNPLDDHCKLGHTSEGVFQEYLKLGQEFLDRRQVLSLGTGTALATDTLVEPLSCVVAAQNRIKDRIAGKNVLVVGAGLMGLLFASINRKMGARKVFLANRSSERLDFAVSRGIIQRSNAFVVDRCVSSQIEGLSSGEGVHIVIICVSPGQGVPAAQDAMSYVNPGGCVYLFAGFRPGDVLDLEGSAKLDAWSIRTDWKMEQIQISGKSAVVAGHRGSRHEDLEEASKIIRDNSLSFTKIISHVISLDVLPEAMRTLAQDGTVQGVQAQRVVVDMAARGRVIESIHEFPLRHLYEATRRQRKAISMGNLFRDIGIEGSATMLGWACPPAWQDIMATVEVAVHSTSLTSKRHFIWVGTGGWIFLVDALKQIVPTNQDVTFHTLQSLDPQALADTFEQIGDLSTAVCLGASQSGKTLETVLLMNALRERFDSAELDYRKHFLWLTDKSGQAAIRSTKEHDWADVDAVALTAGDYSDINALFCAPHSMLMFLPLALLLCGDFKTMRRIYQQYLELREKFMSGILPKAYSVALGHDECIQVSLDESIAPLMGRLVTQLIEQALGSKKARFNPRVCVSASGDESACHLVSVPTPPGTLNVVKLMLTMNALSVFVAMVAYHRRIEFVTHPKVALYKGRAQELLAAPEVEYPVSDPEAIRAGIMMHMSNNPCTRWLQILYYGHIPSIDLQAVKEWMTSCTALTARHVVVDAILGEVWNHSRYQAAVQAEDTAYLILVPQKYRTLVQGISEQTIRGNTRALRAIARATHMRSDTAVSGGGAFIVSHRICIKNQEQTPSN
ncbi:hypothetical protein DL771_007207 [Monosporascus sp. 5C6A]|nr:hypothetical protein DL771_007207 [Monosporascus sp. 5C6A]